MEHRLRYTRLRIRVRSDVRCFEIHDGGTLSENDARFGHPIEFVKEHVLGCFEASKACALLPGKPHLYHVEFLKREDSVDIKNGSALPLDFYLQAHFSPCEEVSWYLHTRKDFPVYEGSTEADEKYVTEHQQGVIDPEIWALNLKMAKHFRETLLDPLVSAVVAANAVAATVPTTPENSNVSVTDSFGCQACEDPDFGLKHTRSCKARRSRFDKINKELDNA